MMVPPAPVPAPDSVAVIEPAEIAVLVAPVDGALTEVAVWFCTTTVLVNALGVLQDW